MLKNFQRYFRYYLALLLFGLLLVGVRWQSAPLGAAMATTETAESAALSLHPATGAMALR
ncbi:hypothetical protein ACFP2F_09115 [Hymenobacter artigasi]|uniref:Uncharacterized protein n=1 Tax=Hymenobacter artigasi TaxID=2719616 RepID=A0ABX1HHE7_9BACT|nr:hypothetical protein [Hymenobacter artigasi]